MDFVVTTPKLSDKIVGSGSSMGMVFLKTLIVVIILGLEKVGAWARKGLALKYGY